MDPKEFGSFIHNCRKELGLSQAALAEKLNVTAKAVSRWERGVGFPDIHLLEPLAEALGITLIELMQSERIREPVSPALVSDAVCTIQSQAELSRKQKKDLVRGTLIIGAGAAFLYYLGLCYDFEPRWIGSLLQLIALVGGVWGWRAFKSILTGSYLREQTEGIWYTWRPWAACGVSTAGLALVIFLKDFVPRDSAWYGLLVILGMALLLPGVYYLYQFVFEEEGE